MKNNDYLGQHIKIQAAAALTFNAAKDLAKQKTKEYGAGSMLLSWFNGKTGEFYPNMKCSGSDRPAWILAAESRGGDLTIDINDGEYIFIFLSGGQSKR